MVPTRSRYQRPCDGSGKAPYAPSSLATKLRTTSKPGSSVRTGKSFASAFYCFLRAWGIAGSLMPIFLRSMTALPPPPPFQPFPATGEGVYVPPPVSPLRGKGLPFAQQVLTSYPVILTLMPTRGSGSVSEGRPLLQHNKKSLTLYPWIAEIYTDLCRDSLSTYRNLDEAERRFQRALARYPSSRDRYLVIPDHLDASGKVRTGPCFPG